MAKALFEIRFRNSWFSLVAPALFGTGCVPERVPPPAEAAASVASAAALPAPSASAQRCKPARAYKPSAVENERDESLAHRGCGVGAGLGRKKRAEGSGIASILVDDDEQILCWARQEIKATHDKTQHAEVRMIEIFSRTPAAPRRSACRFT